MSQLASKPSDVIRPGSLRAWVLACRPATLAASSVPVFVGTACAHLMGRVSWLPALAALFGAGLLQVGSNFANDVFDYEKGADTEARVGPTRAVQAGLISPRAMKRGMALVFGLALLIGVYLTWVSGWWVVLVGLSAIAAAIAYTGGPYPLGYNGLGDVFVMLFFGFVAVLGSTYVQAGALEGVAWLACLPVGGLATAILVVNNIRDAETDRLVGKRTLAVRFGRSAALGEYWLMFLMAYAVPLVLWAFYDISAWVFISWSALPLALRCLSEVRSPSASVLNGCLVRTAKHLALFGVLFALGLALGKP